MCDANVPEITEAYSEVRDDKSTTDWMVVGYNQEDPKAKQLVLVAKGEGGVDSIKEHLKDDQMLYTYFRITVGDTESRRIKFVFMSWCGESVGAMKRAKMSVHKADVKKVMRDFSIELHYTAVADVTEEEIVGRVVKSMGANYSGNT